MRQVVLPDTTLAVSRFSCGTASLHHVGGLDAQVDHLRAALDAGFTHFDTAPLYGYGGAERALGAAFHRDARVTVATKVGLYPPGGASQGRFSSLARKVAGRAVPSLSRAVADFAVARARESLEGSLRRLKRARIDLLLLHEPDLGLVATDEWMDWLTSESDRVGAWGVAGPSQRVAPFVRLRSALSQVVQTRDDLVQREADAMGDRPLQLTYGYLSGDRGGRTVQETLRAALERNRNGSILISTRKRARFRALADLTSDAPVA